MRPLFGHTGSSGGLVEEVGVTVEVPGKQMPIQVERRGDARVAEDLLNHLGRITRLDH